MKILFEIQDVDEAQALFGTIFTLKYRITSRFAICIRDKRVDDEG
ncbi:hypothetical protein [Pseudomonas umsongensis]|nr:hypothetical protein [Pseudomonas umsongensis]